MTRMQGTDAPTTPPQTPVGYPLTTQGVDGASGAFGGRGVGVGRKPRVLSLFAGIGGFDLGLERAGMQTVAFCEIDPFARRVLAKHWPEVPCHDDVRTLSADWLAENGLWPDVICGGFPCQDVSRAGKRAGITGERSGLYRELVRTIRVVRPRYAIVENVAALLADGMGDVLGDLAESGNCVEWDCVPACALGAPHQRDRVWIVAHADDVRCDQRSQVQRGRQDEAEQTGMGVGREGSKASEASDADSERCGEARQLRYRPEQVSAWGTDTQEPSDPTGDGRGQGRPRRPPDSFAGIRDATRRHAADAASKGLEGRTEPETTRGLCAILTGGYCNPWRTWTDEPEISGMDDGDANWVDRTRSTGNGLIPQIPELIGRALIASWI